MLLRRFVIVGGMMFVTMGATCTPTPKSDANTPRLYVLKWERTATGGQGAQTTVQPGGQFTVSSSFLGPNKADIRVYAEETPGVSRLELTGTGRGTCYTNQDPGGQQWGTPSPVNVTLPKQVETAPSGNVSGFLAINLDKSLDNPSCGTRTYNGMPGPREFFLTTGVWTVNAHTENCCGGKADAVFTITVN